MVPTQIQIIEISYPLHDLAVKTDKIKPKYCLKIMTVAVDNLLAKTSMTKQQKAAIRSL